MGEPFKNLLDGSLVRQAAAHLARHDAGFDAQAFERHAARGLDGLEMKARVMRIADALERTLSADFERAAAVLEASLAPPRETLAEMRSGPDGLAGWVLWPVGEFVARRGIDHPDRALRTLHALTQRFSAEFAIRPFIVAHPDRVFHTLQTWTRDDSVHVRRLVSEGSRPRLPWGLRLQSLVLDPSPTLPLLRALQDDPSEYVRRSVANHLNDIAKDHPELVADWVHEHLPGASPERRALLRHASRGLIKQGHRRMLAAWGLDRGLRGQVTLALQPRRVAIGQAVAVSVDLRSTSRQRQRLAIDLVVHHVKADGRWSPRVFKGWVVELDALEQRTLTREHSMRPVTTRRYHPGTHRIGLRVNGRDVAEADFELVEA